VLLRYMCGCVVVEKCVCIVVSRKVEKNYMVDDVGVWKNCMVDDVGGCGKVYVCCVKRCSLCVCVCRTYVRTKHYSSCMVS